MFGDRERPARILAEQERALARYLRTEVYPYSDALRRRLDDAKIDRGRVRSVRELRALPLTDVASITDPVPFILRPDATRIRRHGDPGLRLRLAVASLLGRQPNLAQSRVDPVYKPVQWMQSGGLLVGSSAADLERLAELGRRWLEAAGVRPGDVLVSMVRPGPNLAFWQLMLGARRAGLSALFLDELPSPARLEYLRPTVLAGSGTDVLRAVEGALAENQALGSVHTVLVSGDRFDPAIQRRISTLLPGAEVVGAWAPAGVRALWAQCRGGAGLHTWPATELIELIDPVSEEPVRAGELGEVVWSALGWRGTVLLRVRTGTLATLENGPCASCGRTNPRLRPLTFPAVLDDQPALRAWQAEVRRQSGGRDVVVFASVDAALRDNGDLAAALRTIDEQVGVAQFVVLEPAVLEQRLADHGGKRVLAVD